MYRIMLVDDEENILNALRRVLVSDFDHEGQNYQLTVETFSLPKDALKRAEEIAFDLVISDFRMPVMNGVEFLKAFRKIQPNSSRMILSGYTDLDGLLGAINEAQIYRFINKPWNDFDLKSAIAQALTYRGLIMENERLADLVRVQQGQLSKQEMALKQLEAESPGITKVNWGPDGSVMLDEEDM
ncbi:response regulator [Sulfurirhabdus autotrophica]|uniref:Response regulator receiver domain-containing protein n=1 Tax=Sulfurirhabdus autotrophica TaxID=1706046 RepID=A0A4V2W2W6_9PROT|nr:response regulator [Sulfurirhabdus autotrophica]TCV89649.1 response regulator receiver domain-containing protein [Sulfurirhabdus autotrophica]